jgi:hypothetical protein
MTDNLNLNPLKELMKTISTSISSNQKEIRIPLERSRQIEKSLNQLLIYMVELQDKVIKLQENTGGGAVNIELKGDKF